MFDLDRRPRRIVEALSGPIPWKPTRTLIRENRPLDVPAGRRLKIPCMTVLTATLTCPHCGHKKTETMPTNACVHFYKCSACRAVLRPKSGDCCVFCSYGSSRCPPRQNEGP